MAEKSSQKLSTIWSSKPVRMKLLGAWEIDKTPPHCIPRLCSLTINRLSLTHAFSLDPSPIFIAVRMQNSKRILRSIEIPINVSSQVAHNSTIMSDNNTEIVLPIAGTSDLFDIEIDLTFTLQYPHFLKRNYNHLQIFLQRRKRLKNTALLGFKTLASGFIDMAEVLQKTNIAEKNIDLIKVSDDEEIIAQLSITNIRSQPIGDPDNTGLAGGFRRKGKFSFDHRLDIYSDEDEFTSGDDASDSETVEDNNSMSQFKRRKDRKQRKSQTSRVQNVQQQRNFKQKLFNLIKKFRMPDSEAYDSEEKFQAALEKELLAPGQPDDIDEFFDDEELDDPDDLSDSGQELDDNISISSTPKPSLRPYFSSCTLVEQEIREEESPENSGADTSDTSQKYLDDIKKSKPFHPILEAPKVEATKQKSKLFQKSDKETYRSKETVMKEKEKKPITTALSFTTSSPFVKDDNSPKDFVSDQLSRIFPSDDHFIPEEIIFINLAECLHGPSLVQAFERTNHIVATNTISDVKFAFNFLCGRIQKYCNSNVKSFPSIKIALIGSDAYINLFLRNYVETFSSKSPEWQNYLRFYPVPSAYLTNSSSLLHTYLSSIDSTYSAHFSKNFQHDTSTIQELTSVGSITNNSTANNSLNGINNSINHDTHYVQDLYTKCLTFLRGAQTVLQIPIAEAMVTYKTDKTGQEESNQSFIPFICDAKLGFLDNIYRNHSQEIDDLPNSPPSSQFTAVAVSERLANEKPISSNTSSHHTANIAASSISPQTSSSIGIDTNISNTRTMGISGAVFISAAQGVNVSPLTNREQNIASGSLTPPNSPSISSTSHSFSGSSSKDHKDQSFSSESIDLQIDYWPIQQKHYDSGQYSGTFNSGNAGSSNTSGSKSKSESSKITIKHSFKNLQIYRLPALGESSISSLTMVYVLKEKKQKIMRLGKKKEKENELKCQTVQGIFRMICSNKTTQSPIKVSIDGVELSNVKFFQITNQWQTQVKSFPLVIFRNILNNNDLIGCNSGVMINTNLVSIKSK